MSKGHAAPALYSVLKAIGAIDDEQLMTLREFGSPIQGHPAPVAELPWIDVASGSLGQGLAVGLGMSLSMRLDGLPGRTWVLMGDSEIAEGSVWEAMEAASFHQVDNLIGDPRPQPARPARPHDARVACRPVRPAGAGIRLALDRDRRPRRHVDRRGLHGGERRRQAHADHRADREGPRCLVPRQPGGVARQGGARRHRKAPAIEELGGIRSLTITPIGPEDLKPLVLGELHAAPAPVYTAPVPTRKAFGEALAWLAGHRPDVVVLDGEVGNSTHTEDFEAVAPERFFQMYIAEQCVVGAQTGMQALGKTAFAATFGAFLSRAADFVRMGAISRANLRLCGSHAGVSIGEDGPSQMARRGPLDDARAGTPRRCSIPADGNATIRLVTTMCDLEGISYLRTTREATPVLYGAGRGVPRRRIEDPARNRRRCRHPRGCRRHRARMPRRRRHAGRRRHHRARDRRLQREADRRRCRAPGARRDRA